MSMYHNLGLVFIINVGMGITVCGQSLEQSRFQLINGPFDSWTEAKADAESRGGHLATITGLPEWQQMTNQIGGAITNNHYWWLGASDVAQEGTWRWITDEEFSFTRWAPGEPSGTGVNGKEDYLALSSEWTWNDAAPSIQYPIGYVLEHEPYAFLTNGLVAYFPFNGNANDESGNGHNGTVNSATLTQDRYGRANQAYLFSGNSAYITAPLHSSVFSGDFTASIWFNASDYANGWPTMLQEENQSFTLNIVGQTSGGSGIGKFTSFSHYPGSGHGVFGWYLQGSHTPVSKYCQIVVTKAGTNVTMYLNAVVAATGDVSSPDTQVGNTLYIGRSVTEDVLGGYVFHGSLDDIRIFNRALSSAEVAMLYQYESGPQVSLIKAVKPSLSSLWIGTNYQLQVSTDMTLWTNHGAPFTATNSSMVFPQYWDVDNWGRLFFRLQLAP